MPIGEEGRGVRIRDDTGPAKKGDGFIGVGWATTPVNLGIALKAHCDTTRAKRLLEQSLEVFRELGDTRDIAITILNLADPALSPGDLEGSARHRFLEYLLWACPRRSPAAPFLAIRAT